MNKAIWRMSSELLRERLGITDNDVFIHWIEWDPRRDALDIILVSNTEEAVQIGDGKIIRLLPTSEGCEAPIVDPESEQNVI